MILLRHGESEFNRVYRATGVDPGIPDARLTERGRRQVREVAQTFWLRPGLHIVSSPLTRALETAAILSELMGVPVVVDPLLREQHRFAADVGTVRSVLVERWPTFDFSRVAERWWTEGLESAAAVAMRASAFVGERGWNALIAVTHKQVIRALTGRELGSAQWCGDDQLLVPELREGWDVQGG